MPDLQDDAFALTPSSPLVTTPNAAPPAAPGAPDPYQQRMDALYERQGRMIDRAEASMDREAGLYEEKARALAPVRQRMADLAAQPLPQPPQQAQPPKVPQRNQPGDDETWLMYSGLLGALAGAFTRRHQTNALAAFSGAMEGYQEGSRQKFDQNMKIWEAENKSALERNQQATDHYRSILENRKLSMDQMSVELQMAAAQYDDQAMATAARTKNTLVIAQLYDKQADAAGRMKSASDNLSLKYQQMKQREHLEILKMQMRAVGANSPEQMMATIQAIGEYRAAPIRGKAGTAIMQEVYDRYPDWSEGKWLDAKLRAQIPARAEGARETTEARIGASRETQLDLIIRTARPALQGAAEAASKVDRSTFVPLNKLWQMADEAIGDPNLVEFKMANMTLVEAWARAMNPTGQLTVYNTQRATEILNVAQSPEAYYRQLEYLNRLLDREMKVIQDKREGKPLEPLQLPSPPHSTTIPNMGGALEEQSRQLGERSGIHSSGSLPTMGAKEAIQRGQWGAGVDWLPSGESTLRGLRDLISRGWKVEEAKPSGDGANMPMPPAEGWKVEQVQ